jgi:hypothetical protein
LSSSGLVSGSVREQAAIQGVGQGLQVLEIVGHEGGDERDLSKDGLLVDDGSEGTLNDWNKLLDLSKDSSSIFVSDRGSKISAVSGSSLDVSLQGTFVTVDFKSATVARRDSVSVYLWRAVMLRYSDSGKGKRTSHGE